MVSGSTAFLKAMIRCGSAAVGSARSSCQGISARPMYTPRLLATGEPADAPGAGGVQRVEQTDRVRAEEADGILIRDAAGEVDDVADVVATSEREERVPVGDVEGFHGDPAGEERRDFGPSAPGDDDVVSEVDERAGGVGADHAEAAGNEDHRTTS